MAIYKTDLTQPLPVATPDYAAAARAIETRTKATTTALSTLADIGTKAYSAYRIEDIKSTTGEKGETAEQLADKFLTSNMVAEAAQGKMVQVAGLKGQEEAKLEEAGITDMYGYDAGTEDVTVKARANIQAYGNALLALKKASEGGMPNDEYAARVATIAKNAIAKYPYMSDEIRKMVGETTGLVGADQFAIRQFVASRFSRTGTGGGAGKGVKSVDALMQDENKQIAESTGYTEFDIQNLRNTNPKKFRELKTLATDRSVAKATEEANNTQIKRYAQNGDLAALKNSNLYANTVSIYAQDKSIDNRANEAMLEFKNLAVQLRTNPKTADYSARALQREYTLFSNIQLQAIEEGRQLALQKLRQDRQEFNYNKEQYTEFERQINEQAKTLGKIYAGESSFMGYITALAKNEEANEKQLNDSMRNAYTLAQSLGVNNPVVQAALSGDPAKQKNIKDQYPQLYNVIMQYVAAAESYQGRTGQLDVTYGLSVIQERLHRARYAFVDIYEGLEDTVSIEDLEKRKEADQAAAQAVHAQAQDAVKSSETLTPGQKNTVTTAIAQQQIDGNNAAMLRADFESTKKAIEQKFNANEYIALRQKVAQANVVAVERLAEGKAMFERQYGASIKLTALPDGTLRVEPPVKPAMIYKSAPSMFGRFENPSAPLTPEGMQYKKDMIAYKEFQRVYGNTLITSVFGAATVTDKTPGQHAQHIANAINNNTPYEFMPDVGGGRGVEAGSPGITNYDYETGQVKAPSIYSGTQAEREAYADQQRGKVAEGQAVLEQADKQLRSTITKLAPKATTRSLKSTTESAVSLRSDIYSLEWLNDEQAGILYRNVKALFDSGELSNPTRFAKTLKTATDEDKKAILKAFNIKEGV